MRIAFVHGFLLSLGLILPIGMQNGFILTQGALHRRFAYVLPAVITASLCDTLLIGLAVIGVSAVALQIRWLRYGFGLVGIVFLLWMGRAAWLDSPELASARDSTTTAWTAKRQIGFTSSVSLLNPHALIDTLAVLGGSAVAYTAWNQRLAFGAASVLVSWIWFFTLALLGHLAGRQALKRLSLRWLNRLSAVMMWASSIYLAYVVWSFH